MRLRQNLLHGAIAGLRLEIALDNPVIRHFNQRFFHRFHKARQTPGPGITFHWTWDHANFTMTAFYQIPTRHVTAFEGVINDRIGKVGFSFAPVHDDHRNMAVLFEHRKQRLRILRTHHQQTINALLRHHRQIGLLLFETVPCVTQNQRIAFLETVFLHGFDNFCEIGRFAAGRQQANRLGVIHLQAAGNCARRIVQFFDRCPDSITRFFRDKARLVNYV